MNLLAKSCFAPGLIAMLSNMIASSGDVTRETDEEWILEYTNGMGHEIYRKDIHESSFGNNFRFADIVEQSYTIYGAIVFALEI